MKLRISFLTTLAALVILSIALPAMACVSATGPFTGTWQETWESFPNYVDMNYGYLSNPTEIFGGNATISNGCMCIYQPDAGATWWLDATSTNVADGEKGMGLNNIDQTAYISFKSPVDSFGAYWAAIFGNTVSLTFYDVSGRAFDTESFDYPGIIGNNGCADLEWHGWNSEIPVSGISYTGDYVAIDGLQANPVPEPSSFLALAGGLFGFAGGLVRRKK